MMSSSFITSSSSPSTLTSVPAYLPNNTWSPDLDVETRELHRTLKDPAIAYGNNFTLDWFLGRGIRNDDSAGGCALFFHALYDDSIMKRTNLHGAYLL